MSYLLFVILLLQASISANGYNYPEPISAVPLPASHPTASYLAYASYDNTDASISTYAPWTFTVGATNRSTGYELISRSLNNLYGDAKHAVFLVKGTNDIRIELSLTLNYTSTVNNSWLGVMLTSSTPFIVYGNANSLGLAAYNKTTGPVFWLRLKPNGAMTAVYHATQLTTQTNLPGTALATSSSQCNSMLSNSLQASFTVVIQIANDIASVNYANSTSTVTCFSNVAMPGVGQLLGNSMTSAYVAAWNGHDATVLIPKIHIFKLFPNRIRRYSARTNMSTTTAHTVAWGNLANYRK